MALVVGIVFSAIVGNGISSDEHSTKTAPQGGYVHSVTVVEHSLEMADYGPNAGMKQSLTGDWGLLIGRTRSTSQSMSRKSGYLLAGRESMKT
eukprot:2018774-Amphidinium_carterae.1